MKSESSFLLRVISEIEREDEEKVRSRIERYVRFEREGRVRGGGKILPSPGGVEGTPRDHAPTLDPKKARRFKAPVVACIHLRDRAAKPPSFPNPHI